MTEELHLVVAIHELMESFEGFEVRSFNGEKRERDCRHFVFGRDGTSDVGREWDFIRTTMDSVYERVDREYSAFRRFSIYDNDSVCW